MCGRMPLFRKKPVVIEAGQWTGTVIGVRFATGKVTYDVDLHVGGETLRNVDSTFVS